MTSAAANQIKYPKNISRLNGYDHDAVTYVPVVIIGAGESGIAMGCRLKEALGFDQFRIYDRQAGIGGTWWINRYPGVACDVPALFYSFSFCQNLGWSTFFPPGPEIVKYLNDVCNKYQITDKIQCNTSVQGCKWIESEQLWEIYLEHMVPGTGDLAVKDRNALIEKDGRQAVFVKRETVRAKVVVSAVGGLVEPNAWPKNIPGKDNFKGEIFHSARWRYDVDFNNKDVVVVGTGCSAAQFVPRLTKAPFNAKSVTQLMRSPPWVVPRFKPPGGDSMFEKHSPALFTQFPLLANVIRKAIFLVLEVDFYRLFGMEEHNIRWRKRVENHLLKHMRRTVPAKYHDMLTPDYGVGCKRRIFDATWFPGLQDERIELTTQPLKSVQEKSVTIGPGRTYPATGPQTGADEHEIPADIIVLANGFETTHWLHPLKVEGRNGIDIVEEMDRRGGPQAYQGTAMDGFPNFFMIFGPNTATGHSSVILASENMVNYSLNFIKPVLNGDATTVEVKRSAEEAYTADLQKALGKSVWNSGGCHSWYVHDGWNASVYPYSQIWFGLRCWFPIWNHWNVRYTSKGLARLQVGRLFKLASLVATLVVAYRVRRSGEGWEGLKKMLWRAVENGMEQGFQALFNLQQYAAKRAAGRR